MSPFEIIMLLCFGAAWPFSILKSWKAKSNKGKSLPFLCIVLIGYLSGILHKLFFNYDGVIWIYAMNSLLVSADLSIYLRNYRYSRR